MNLLQIDREFKKLRKIEDYITFKFEPRSSLQNGKRHIYYKDLKSDFVDEVNAYGFSPFIQKTYDQQKKDKNIMKYKNKDFQNGLLNFVKKSHNKVHEKVVQINKFNEQGTNNDNKDVFLQKALENLAKNKIHYSEDSNELTIDDLPKKEEKNDNKDDEEKKEKNQNKHLNKGDKKTHAEAKGVSYKVNVNPFLSLSGFNQPEPIKKNFDKFFNALTNKKPNSHNHPKRQIAIFKTKAIENQIKNKDDMKRTDPLEWNRNEVYLADAMKVISKKEKSSDNPTRLVLKSPKKKLSQNFLK